jgi:hypothetical protein
MCAKNGARRTRSRYQSSRCYHRGLAHPLNTSRASSVTSPCFIRRSGIGAMLHSSITVASRHRRATTSSGFTGGAWFPQLVRSWLRTAATSSLVSWSANAGMGDG